MEKNTHPAWMDDDLVKDISPKKLAFLSQIFMEGQGKNNQKDMMTFLMPLMKKAKAENLTFSQSEISACIQAIKKHATTEENNQIDSILKKAKGQS